MCRYKKEAIKRKLQSRRVTDQLPALREKFIFFEQLWVVAGGWWHLLWASDGWPKTSHQSLGKNVYSQAIWIVAVGGCLPLWLAIKLLFFFRRKIDMACFLWQPRRQKIKWCCNSSYLTETELLVAAINIATVNFSLSQLSDSDSMFKSQIHICEYVYFTSESLTNNLYWRKSKNVKITKLKKEESMKL